MFMPFCFFFFLQKWLKPGGELLISDYCRGPKELSETMKAYVAKRHYHLLTPPDYGKVTVDKLLYIYFGNINSQPIKLYVFSNGISVFQYLYYYKIVALSFITYKTISKLLCMDETMNLDIPHLLKLAYATCTCSM